MRISLSDEDMKLLVVPKPVFQKPAKQDTSSPANEPGDQEEKEEEKRVA